MLARNAWKAIWFPLLRLIGTFVAARARRVRVKTFTNRFTFVPSRTKLTWMCHVRRAVRSYWTVIAKESTRLTDHTRRTLVAVLMRGCCFSSVAIKLSRKTICARGKRTLISRPLASFADITLVECLESRCCGVPASFTQRACSI